MTKQILKPLFEVDVHLEGDKNGEGNCNRKTSRTEVQSFINKDTSLVFKTTKNVQNWNQKDQPEDLRKTLRLDCKE